MTYQRKVFDVRDFGGATRAALQAAVDAANAFGIGAVVEVPFDITSDGTVLNLKPSVMVDFLGHTFKLPATTAVLNLVGTVSGTNTDAALTANAAEGDVTVTVSVANSANYAAGDFVQLFDSASNAKRQPTIVKAVDGGTGVITLQDPLGHPYTTANGATIRKLGTPLENAGIRNVVLDGNGNTGSGSRLLSVSRMVNCTFENITAKGTLVPTDSAVIFSIAYRCDFKRIWSTAVRVGASVRDLVWQNGMTRCRMTDIRSEDCDGFGPAFSNTNFSTIVDVMSVRAAARGLRLDQSSYNTLTGIISCAHRGASGDGLRFAFDTHHNAIDGIVTCYNENEGVIFDGQSGGIDESNIVQGLVSIGNTVNDVHFGEVSKNLVSGIAVNVQQDGTDQNRFIRTDTNPDPAEAALTNNTNRTPSTTRATLVTIISEFNTLATGTTATATVTVGGLAFARTLAIRNFDAVSGQRLSSQVTFICPPNKAYKINWSTTTNLTITAVETPL